MVLNWSIGFNLFKSAALNPILKKVFCNSLPPCVASYMLSASVDSIRPASTCAPASSNARFKRMISETVLPVCNATSSAAPAKSASSFAPVAALIMIPSSVCAAIMPPTNAAPFPMVLPIAENPFLRPAKPRFTSSPSNPTFTVVPIAIVLSSFQVVLVCHWFFYLQPLPNTSKCDRF